MLPTPNQAISGNDNDSDFTIINTPSPQPKSNYLNMPNTNISKLQESEEMDSFENLSMSNLSSKSMNTDSNEPSEFALINVAFQDAQSDHEKLISSSPEPEPINDMIVKSTVNLTETEAEDYGEQKVEIMPLPTKSDSASPKASMDEIINLIEPLNSSSSNLANDEIIDGPLITNEENQPLINKINAGHKRKNNLLKREYERYMMDKCEDPAIGCNSYLCCRIQSMSNDVTDTRNFFDKISSLADFMCGYMEKCFGQDQFDDSVPGKSDKQLQE